MFVTHNELENAYIDDFIIFYYVNVTKYENYTKCAT